MADDAPLTGHEEPAGSFLKPLLGFARAAERFAQRTASAFGVLALLALVSAGWLAFYGRNVLELPVWANLPLVLGLGAPPITLLGLYWVLRQAIGLPDRILEAFERLHGGTKDMRVVLADRVTRSREQERKAFGDLIRTGRALWSVRGGADEAIEALTVARGAMVLWTPLFPLLLIGTSVLSGATCVLGASVLALHLLI